MVIFESVVRECRATLGEDAEHPYDKHERVSNEARGLAMQARKTKDKKIHLKAHGAYKKAYQAAIDASEHAYNKHDRKNEKRFVATADEHAAKAHLHLMSAKN